MQHPNCNRHKCLATYLGVHGHIHTDRGEWVHMQLEYAASIDSQIGGVCIIIAASM